MSGTIFAWRWCKCGKCGVRHRDVLPLTPAQHLDTATEYRVLCNYCAYATAAARKAYQHLQIRMAGHDPLTRNQ